MQDDNTGNDTEPTSSDPNIAPTPLPYAAGEDQSQVGKLTPISWSGSEFIAHHKNKQWFLTLAIIILVAAGGVYFLTGSIFSAVIIAIMGITFAIVAGRSPRTVNYSVNSDGVQVGDRFHEYSEFKSFSLYEEGVSNSIRLNPFKRFAPSTNIYYDPNDEEKIVELLSEYLPHEEASKDPIDQLMHKIRY